jgi:hypothetical protein
MTTPVRVYRVKSIESIQHDHDGTLIFIISFSAESEKKENSLLRTYHTVMRASFWFLATGFPTDAFLIPAVRKFAAVRTTCGPPSSSSFSRSLRSFQPRVLQSLSTYSSESDLSAHLEVRVKGVFQPVAIARGPEELRAWEREITSLSAEIRACSDSAQAALIYQSILRHAALVELDPLQFTSFEVLTNAAIDQLTALTPPSTGISELVDVLTDIHLEFVEDFKVS